MDEVQNKHEQKGYRDGKWFAHYSATQPNANFDQRVDELKSIAAGKLQRNAFSSVLGATLRRGIKAAKRCESLLAKLNPGAVRPLAIQKGGGERVQQKTALTRSQIDVSRRRYARGFYKGVLAWCEQQEEK